MPGDYIVIYRAAGTLITELIYNHDHQVHIDGRAAEFMGAFGISSAQYQLTEDPYPGSVISLPPSLAGELTRLRFALQQIISTLSGDSSTVNWYDQLTSPGFPVVGARIARTTDISIPNNFPTPISFSGGTADFNTGVYDDMSAPTRFTAPYAGKYLAFAQVTWSDASNVGRRQLNTGMNSFTTIGSASTNLAPDGYKQTQTVTSLFDMQIGDYVQFSAFQNSGGALNLTTVVDGALSGSFVAAAGGLVFLGAS